jgi:hypothetical protein
MVGGMDIFRLAEGFIEWDLCARQQMATVTLKLTPDASFLQNLDRLECYLAIPVPFEMNANLHLEGECSGAAYESGM